MKRLLSYIPGKHTLTMGGTEGDMTRQRQER